MNVETTAAIERLSERINGLDGSLRAEMAKLGTGLRAEFREGLAANRVHTEVLVESLRDDIRILADGFAAISVKLDAMSR